MKENVLRKEIEIPEETDEKKEGLLSKALHVGAQATNLGHEALRFKTNVSNAVTDAFEDGKREAKRALKRGYNAAEDLVDETSYRVKHNPMKSVAIAFGVGVLFGGVITGLTRKLFRA
jgi:ElaB/YqjD/DUF883 family membrane-anchored ribosome-binding protein